MTDGTIHAGDPVAAQAQADITAAYNNLAGQACTTILTGQDLGGLTLLPGVYCFNATAQLTGILTLDGQGDPNAVFVFQMGSTLTTISNASVVLSNGASSCNVFWQVGSSATIGVDTAFIGSMLVFTSVTLNDGASVTGRVLAQNGAVTMVNNHISTPCTPALATPPIITSNGGGATASLSVAENATTLTTVAASGEPAPTYSLNGGADVSKFFIDNSTGVLSFIVAPDFELPTDVGANNSYDVIVHAANSSGADEQAIMVTVTDVADNPPTITVNGGGVLNVMNGNTISLTLSFVSDPQIIAAMSFSLDFDATCLTFDSVTDSNGDDIPNAVSGLPSGYVTTVAYDAGDTDGEIDISISDQVNPIQALSDGTLATFQFGIQSSCRTNDGTTKNVAFAFDQTPTGPMFHNVEDEIVAGLATGATYLLRFNAYPTDIALTATSVAENVALATTVGTLSSTDTDADLSQTHTYNLVSGAGSTDNGSFILAGSMLKTNAVLNYEQKSSYAIRLRTTDNLGGTFEKAFTITVNNVNEAPTSFSIANGSVAENTVSGTTVSSFNFVDQDAGATATYSLVSGPGSTDNGSFAIVAGVLKTSAVFNYEAKNAYNIRMRVTDNTTLSFEKAFTILVTDMNDAPVAVADVVDPTNQVIAGATELFVLTNDTDPDINDVLSVAAVGSANSGTAITSTTSIRYTPAAAFNGVVTFSYTVRDNHNGGTLTDTDNVTVTVVANDARGDCNSDGAVNAGDFPAFVLELNDTDVSSHWYELYQQGFVGSPRGCDANVSKSVTIADLTCAILVIFGNTVCTTSIFVLAASTLADAELAVGQNLVGVPSSTVNVSVRLTTNGQNVAAASFALSFDQDQLTFDATDADQNGLPDAVTFNTPQGMVTTANYDATVHRLEIAVYAVTMPMPTLGDGLVANVTLQVNEQAGLVATPITLVKSSLGSDQGQAVPVRVNDGAVQIVPARLLFLPMVNR